MKTVFRKDRFGEKQPNCLLRELINNNNEIRPLLINPYKNQDKSELQTKIIKRYHWRYHHNLDFLKKSKDNIHEAYIRRVDTMFDMLVVALEMLGYNSQNLKTVSAIDLGCAEGFTAMYLRDKGLAQIDCFDLNEEQLDRFQLIEAYKGIEESNKFVMDLERPGWALELDKSYDLVLCLGVLYHMENPMLFMRNVFEITKYACILESDTPIVSKNDGGYLKQVEQQVTKKQGNIRYILELRPNINALIDMALAVGFSSVSIVEPPDGATCPYLKRGTKSIVVCRK